MSATDGVPPPGSLIAVEHAGARVLALVRGSTRGLIEVVTEGGDALSLSTAKIISTPGHQVEVSARADDDAGRMRDLRRRVDEARDELDLQTIWELVSTEGSDPMSVGDLASLWFGNDDAVAFFATEEALLDDAVYFKRKKERYEARADREVESVLQQQEAESRKSAVRERFVGALAARSAESDPSDLGELEADPELRSLLELLLDFAAIGDQYERRTEAARLVEEVGRGGREAVRPTAQGAFQLLLRHGVVEEHENLALRRYRIRTDFPPDVEAEAEDLAASATAWTARVADRSALRIVTIDDLETRDLDDAIHLRWLEDGRREVGIHITDVAALVSPDSTVDLEARRRASSVYLPTGVIPMLPRVLSEDRLSLVAGEERPALSYVLTLDDGNEVVDRRIELSRIRVGARLSYEEADAILDDANHPLQASLAELLDLSEARKLRRIEAGAVEIELPEIRVRVIDGEIVVTRLERSLSRFLVSEMMILAGETAARFCLEQRIPTVFRVQDPVVDDAEQSRAEAIDDDLARQLHLVRFLRRGELRSVAAPHYGLGLDAYVQATSPMRRYSDLIVDYQIRRHLSGDPLVWDAEEMVALAARTEAAAQDCVNAQRDSERYWLLEYLRRTAADELEALVLEHDPRSNRATTPIVLPDTMLRTTVPARGLEVGQRIAVRLVRADPRRDVLRVDMM